MPHSLSLINSLRTITTKDASGRHFTEFCPDWEELESAGLITVNRPIHGATGIPYGQEHWSITVTAEGQRVAHDAQA